MLAPPGATSSIMGLITIPVMYYPFMLVFMDLLIDGHSIAVTGMVGLIVGHLWYWAIFGGTGGRGPLYTSGTAPRWLKRMFGRSLAGRQPLSGVHVTPARERTTTTPGRPTTGYQWGEGRRLGG